MKMKIISWILGTIIALFIAGQIFITNETLSGVLYNIFYYGSSLLFIIIYLFITFQAVKLLGYDSLFSKINKIGYLLIFIFVFIGILISNYLTGEKYKSNLSLFSNYLSNHIEIRKGKMPIFYIDDELIKNKSNTGTILKNH